MIKMNHIIGCIAGAALGIMAFAAGMPADVQVKTGFFVEAEAATSRTRDEAVQWTYGQEGKYLDFDKAFGAQCVDLIKYYYDFFGVASYAKGNGYQYATNALPKGWTRIKNYAEFVPEPGDIAVWGHVVRIPLADGKAIYREAKG